MHRQMPRRNLIRFAAFIATVTACVAGPASAASAAGYAPAVGYPNSEFSGWVSDSNGGNHCTFTAQYGNFWTAAFAKIRLNNTRCHVTRVASYQTSSTGCCDYRTAQTTSIGAWVSPFTTAYTTGYQARFRVTNDSGATYCFTYVANTTSSARYSNCP